MAKEKVQMDNILLNRDYIYQINYNVVLGDLIATFSFGFC